MITTTDQLDHQQRLASIGAAAWRPKERISTADWCAQHVRLSPDWEASGGRYNLDDRPYWREILDCFDDPDVYEITLLKSTQIGGTLTLIAALLSRTEIHPAPAMVCTPNRDSAIEFRDRVYANAAASPPPLRDRVPPKSNWNTRHLDLGSMRCYLAWSGSAQRLRGRACCWVLETEIDVYETGRKGVGDPLAAAGERVKSFFRSKIYKESSPSGDPSPIEQSYHNSDMRRLLCPCPHCGTYQELRFIPYKHGELAGRGGIAGLTDEDGNFLEPEQARGRAHYVCVAGCKIGPEHKQQMIERGRWVPKGQRLDKRGRLRGKPARGKRHAGFHLWSIHSPRFNWGDLAATYLEFRRDGKLREFLQDWLGMRATTQQKLPHWKRLGTRLAFTHVRSSVPQPAWFLTSGADVQDSGIYYVVRAWGDGCTSWGVDWGFLPRYDTDPESESTDRPVRLKTDLLQLDAAVLNRVFPIADDSMNPLGKSQLRVRLLAIDSNYRPHDVHEFVRSRDGRRIRCSRGDHKVKPSERFRCRTVERNTATGREYTGGMQQWGIFVDVYKEDLLGRFAAPIDEAGAFLFPSNVIQTGGDYLRQLVNENKAIERDQHGRPKTVWKVRSETLGNHYWDCEIYARAAADMVLAELGLNWDASTWPRPQKGRRRVETDLGLAARDD